jgi:DNA polymerase/3'-5' exonuclease PolX
VVLRAEGIFVGGRQIFALPTRPRDAWILFPAAMSQTATKTRYPRAAAIAVARELCASMAPACARLCVAGSLRRMKPDVGDVEIVFLPRYEKRKWDLFAERDVSLAEEAIDELLRGGVLIPRENRIGGHAWGGKNKLAVHVESGLPVDLFGTVEPSWWNTVVCRTGAKEMNVRIAAAARSMGWQWNPYDSGFTRLADGARHAVASERDVFEFAGLPFLEPWER